MAIGMVVAVLAAGFASAHPFWTKRTGVAELEHMERLSVFSKLFSLAEAHGLDPAVEKRIADQFCSYLAKPRSQVLYGRRVAAGKVPPDQIRMVDVWCQATAS
jgi:hypothetical protein